jgi:hypothetical protein
MAFRYATVVPWGRSYAEYLRMFALGPAEVAGRILGCGDGPASFNCEMVRRGRRVTSADPLYRLGRAEIERRIDETYDDVIRQTRREQHRFVWDAIPSVEELGRVRMTAMRAFLADYDAGRREGRYVAAGLPHLPFPTRAFDLALCSHLLFFYSGQLSLDFHREALRELCRVAGEVRIFPLVDVNGLASEYASPLLDDLVHEGFAAEILEVPYEFQRGGNRMLRLEPPS